MTLLLHTGGWEATKADLAAVPVPDPTNSYVPVPYTRFIEEVKLHVPRFGLTIQGEQFALARRQPDVRRAHLHDRRGNKRPRARDRRAQQL